MGLDTFSDEETESPSMCRLFGHRYIKIGSRTKTWKETEEELVSGGSGDGEGAVENIYDRVTKHYSVDVVAYKCSRCGDETTREENEQNWL